MTAAASSVVDGDSRVQETLKEFVQADLRLKSVIDGVQSEGDRRCHSLRELVDLEMEARTCTKTMRQLLARLENLASEEDNDIARAAFMRDVENYAAQLHQSQLHLRRSVLTAKKRLEATERQALMPGESAGGGPVAGSGLRQRSRTGPGEGANAAVSLTEEMRDLSHNLSAQVERSKQTMDHLVQSSATIDDTRREYQNMSEHIERSSRLLTKLDRRELTDRVLIFLAFAFFFITCAYIVKKRLFAGATTVPASTDP